MLLLVLIYDLETNLDVEVMYVPYGGMSGTPEM